MPIFQQLGMIETVEPQEKAYTHLVVLGGDVPRMHRQIEWIKRQTTNGLRVDVIYFLTGQRPLDKAVDLFGPIDRLPQNKQPKTEAEAAQWLGGNGDIKDGRLKGKAVFVSVPPITCPDGHVRYPSIADVVQMGWMKTRVQPGKTLALSANPLIGYEHAVVWQILEKTGWFDNGGTLETVGEGIKTDSYRENEHLDLYLDIVARRFNEEYNFFFGNNPKSPQRRISPLLELKDKSNH
jgi:hypothetical protein